MVRDDPRWSSHRTRRLRCLMRRGSHRLTVDAAATSAASPARRLEAPYPALRSRHTPTPRLSVRPRAVSPGTAGSAPPVVLALTFSPAHAECRRCWRRCACAMRRMISDLPVLSAAGRAGRAPDANRPAAVRRERGSRGERPRGSTQCGRAPGGRLGQETVSASDRLVVLRDDSAPPPGTWMLSACARPMRRFPSPDKGARRPAQGADLHGRAGLEFFVRDFDRKRAIRRLQSHRVHDGGRACRVCRGAHGP